MRKTIFLIGIAVFLLSACDAGSEATSTATEVVVNLPNTPTPGAECTSIKVLPTPGAEEESLFPSVSENDMVRGPADAVVTIIEYGDFQ